MVKFFFELVKYTTSKYRIDFLMENSLLVDEVFLRFYGTICQIVLEGCEFLKITQNNIT